MRIVRDERLDRRERAHLQGVLGGLAGNPAWMTFSLATDLPVDRPEPEVRNTMSGRPARSGQHRP
ncbi:MAG: hypothetical protein ACYC6F_19105 [Longimicrobiales bacterium]